MKWLSRIWRGRSAASHDEPKSLPPGEASQAIRLHVTSADEILLDERPVLITELEHHLRSVYQPGAVIFYWRDNPEQDSAIASSVMHCVCQMGLPIAVPTKYVPQEYLSKEDQALNAWVELRPPK
jgi:hypothetical protein